MALAHAKIKTTKISSEGLTGNSAEVCTSENFPLYDNSLSLTFVHSSLATFEFDAITLSTNSSSGVHKGGGTTGATGAVAPLEYY